MAKKSATFGVPSSPWRPFFRVALGARRFFALLLALVLALSAGCATAGAGRKPALDLAVEAASKRCGCRMGVAARHLESGRSYAYNGDAEFESASLIKIAVVTEVMAEVREGRLDLSERWMVTGDNKADGSGVLRMLDPGLNPTWNDLVTLMIGPSDNTAANAWIRRLTIEAINARMESLGFHHIRLLSMIPPLSSAHDELSAWRNFRLGILTAREVADWMSQVAQGRLLDSESSRRIFEYLDQDPTRLRIARRFPAEFLWAGKSGTMRAVCNDAGILRTKKGRFVLVVLTDRAAAQSSSIADHPSVLAMAELARVIVESWSRELPNVVEKPR